MPSIPGEIADAIVNALESPEVQETLTAAVAAGEVPLQAVVDNALEHAKASGTLGTVIAAAKGTVEARVNAQISSIQPATAVGWLTKLAQQEAKALGG